MKIPRCVLCHRGIFLSLFSVHLQKTYPFSKNFPALYHIFAKCAMLNFFLLYTIILVKDGEFHVLSRHFDTIYVIEDFIQFST